MDTDADTETPQRKLGPGLSFARRGAIGLGEDIGGGLVAVEDAVEAEDAAQAVARRRGSDQVGHRPAAIEYDFRANMKLPFQLLVTTRRNASLRSRTPPLSDLTPLTSA